MHFFTEALAAATRRGVKLGNPNGANDLRACGVTSVRAVAEELNARGVLTPRVDNGIYRPQRCIGWTAS